MHLILTHEHADFDAIASQLAASRLLSDTLPVLPYQVNRNVRHFTRLYWDELPFVKADEIGREPVARVWLVDTQTLQSLPGISEDTEVQIIDHHDARPDLNPAWQTRIEPVGATTTLLVEELQSRQITLSPVEASLLALGIYEDTGSLTFGRTTSRDVYAAAWLLEQGASLDLMQDFLNEPLLPEQREIYEQFLDSAAIHTIQGYSIVIAQAESAENVDEISALAQRIGAIFDADGLFLLVNLQSHIQMVARSSTDAVDVGMITREFGGGGHTRAAAAMLHSVSLVEASRQLLDALGRLVQPAMTVESIMSYGVRTLPADTTIGEADKQMRRYGYEGFPVVTQGRIVGLLTRRDVDRAVEHGLARHPIQRIMEAGEVSVLPSDSLATLQHVMMESGWGQVPVVKDGELLGVVTRTDLIKTMGDQSTPPTYRDRIATRLEATLPPLMLALVREVGRIAEEMNVSLFVVGGFVRDLLLGTPPGDMDFVVEGDAIRLTKRLQSLYGGDRRIHSRFGTGKWLIDAAAWQRIADQLGKEVSDVDLLPHHIDFVTARTEFYNAPTALPEVEHSSIKLDMHRRDFTINTLALRLDPDHFGELLDFYGGERDLQEKRIRVLHSLSFVDDPTRMLRAARLEQRLGFQIGPRTEELIRQALSLLDRVSGDRIRHELEFTFEEPLPELVVCRLTELGVLNHLSPTLPCDLWLKAAFGALRYAIQQPLWTALAEEIDVPLAHYALLTQRLNEEERDKLNRRLKVRASTATALNSMQLVLDGITLLLNDQALPSAIDNLLAGCTDEILVALWAGANNASVRDHVTAYARTYRNVSPITNGDLLISRGLKPGPRFGRVLDTLRRAWLDDEITSHDEEMQLLDRLLAEELVEESR